MSLLNQNNFFVPAFIDDPTIEEALRTHDITYSDVSRKPRINHKIRGYYRALKELGDSIIDALKLPGDIELSHTLVGNLFQFYAKLPSKYALDIICSKGDFIGVELFTLNKGIFSFIPDFEEPIYILGHEIEVQNNIAFLDESFEKHVKPIRPSGSSYCCSITYLCEVAFGSLLEIETKKELRFSNPFKEITFGNIDKRNLLNDIYVGRRNGVFSKLDNDAEKLNKIINDDFQIPYCDGYEKDKVKEVAKYLNERFGTNKKEKSVFFRDVLCNRGYSLKYSEELLGFSRATFYRKINQL